MGLGQVLVNGWRRVPRPPAINIKPNNIKVNTYSSNEQFLVLGEIYYSNGWKAYNNNKEIKIFEVNSVLRGVLLPSGNNIIEYKFEPKDIKIGSMLSLISMIITLLFIFTRFIKNNEKL